MKNELAMKIYTSGCVRAVTNPKQRPSHSQVELPYPNPKITPTAVSTTIGRACSGSDSAAGKANQNCLDGWVGNVHIFLAFHFDNFPLHSNYANPILMSMLVHEYWKFQLSLILWPKLPRRLICETIKRRIQQTNLWETLTKE